ncbi:HD domain-containing protein [Clostridium algidicarnis]|uniref:HD domain-containing protein n=1 Tax=Clostridium algidicarnis TaxID=37659 RepID=UPI00209B2B5C|nr:HD domain-containing protein [Clostridium algidicarnis]
MNKAIVILECKMEGIADMIYRIKQFLWYIISPFKPIDYNFLKSYLDKEEVNLFSSLKSGEKQHCIRVAKASLQYINNEESSEICSSLDKAWFMKVCLLHDIGKKFGSLSIIDKSLLVIINKLFKDKMNKYMNVKKIDVYYNHPIKGYEYLKQLNKYDERFLYVIKNHHNYKVKGDEMLNILVHFDNLN